MTRRRTIGQREAHRLKKRVALLENILIVQRRTYSQEWPGGIEIATEDWSGKNDIVPLALRTARNLGHAVVALGDHTGTVRFVALPHPKETV